ncbi:MAG TPA: hypothetical protein VHT91_28130 [Kofleriaceae bacterium]|jgi:hypothetical protein|nr:hypothetical protein [Kofleriaceae bacterium]
MQTARLSIILGSLIVLLASACTGAGDRDDDRSLGTAMAAATADNCAHALDGAYCGYSTMDGFSGHGDGHTIYDCSAHRTTGTSHCSTNCVVAPSGQADFCAPAVNNCAGAADGVYCGFSTMDGFSGLGDAHTLYSCSGHVTTGTSHCANACLIAPPGQPDTCSSCGGTVCGTRCCPAGDWCGTGNRCCSGCTAGCVC